MFQDCRGEEMMMQKNIVQIPTIDYERHLKESRVRMRNDRLWTLAIVGRNPRVVSGEIVEVWRKKYPTAYLMVLQRVDDGFTTIN
jgi:hypothetical protein